MVLLTTIVKKEKKTFSVTMRCSLSRPFIGDLFGFQSFVKTTGIGIVIVALIETDRTGINLLNSWESG
jgi:hypothetical protein